MSSGLYPTLEDLTIDAEAKAQILIEKRVAEAPSQGIPSAVMAASLADAYSSSSSSSSSSAPSLYPSLAEFGQEDYLKAIGVGSGEVSNEMVAAHNASVLVAAGGALAVPLPGEATNRIATLTKTGDLGVARARVKDGIRLVSLGKDDGGKLGLAVREFNKGIFVSFVWAGSPAALAGIRFGDQIIAINGQETAGLNDKKALRALKDLPAKGQVSLAIRDRPFDRTITLRKDSENLCGFLFKNNRITAIVKDSSASRNGLLVDDHIAEINGVNVVGLRDSEAQKVLEEAPASVTLTLIPHFFFHHLVKKLGFWGEKSSMVRKYMDHSVPPEF